MPAISFQRDIPVYEESDVVVIGGGPAGIAAAIGAKRAGQSVTLIERAAQLGGMATIGSVAIYMPIGTRTGFYDQLCSELMLQDVFGREWGTTSKYAPLFSPFVLRQYLNQKVQQEGITVHFHMEFIGTMEEGGRLTHVVCMSRQGLVAIGAKSFIDCTGNAHVAIDAGVQTHSGRDKDGATQPMTLMLIMQDTGKPVPRILPEGCPTYNTIEELPQGRTLHWEDKSTGTLLVNMTRVRGNAAKIADVDRCELEALAQAFGVVDYLQRNGYENYILAHMGSQTGVRETNQIVGLYTLSEEDLVRPSRFDDVATQCDYEIDIHNPDGKGGCDERHVELYDIPYRCFVPATGPANLLVAGRALSASHVGMSSARVMPACFGMGQACGVAAAIANEKQTSMRDVPIPAFHEALQAQGVHFLDHGNP